MHGAKGKKNGFTLIELLVVIAIIGIIAMIVVAFLHGADDQARDKKIVSQLDSMKTQANLFNAALEPAPVIQGPYSGIIIGAAEGGMVGEGTLFNDKTQAHDSVYSLAAGLPAGTTMYYGWDGAYPLTGGRWFFAASTSTGAFCVDYTGGNKIGNLTPARPAGSEADFMSLFPNATNMSINPYFCN